MLEKFLKFSDTEFLPNSLILHQFCPALLVITKGKTKQLFDIPLFFLYEKKSSFIIALLDSTVLFHDI